MHEMESAHGGLFRALLAKRRERGRARRRGEPLGAPVGRLTSFREGTEALVRALVRSLEADGVALALGTRASSLRPLPGGGYALALAGGAAALEADAVVLAGTARESASILEALEPEVAADLRSIESAPLAVVALGWDAARLGHPLDGFGFLAPRGEGLRVLGALWDSSVFPGRAPAGRALVRAMVGGATDPAAAALPEGELVELVRGDLERTMGIAAKPDLVRVFRYPLGIPQYTVGHLERLERIEARLRSRPGLVLAGSSYRGVAINACVAEAPAVAGRVLAALGLG
jgi:oxygen-dependent protoporphyrinogen oxidase